MQSKDHWERVYKTKAIDAVSWYQEHAQLSMRLIRDTGVAVAVSIIDVGGGASVLVDELLAAGYSKLTVLDLSGAAIGAAQTRLGPLAGRVQWLEGDITTIELPAQHYEVWHDRAVFHFLTAPQQRAAYVRALVRAVRPGGHVIIATFAEDGPTQCSGLPVVRYRAEQLHAELGDGFELVSHAVEEHHTPFGTVQKFVYCRFSLSASGTGRPGAAGVTGHGET